MKFEWEKSHGEVQLAGLGVKHDLKVREGFWGEDLHKCHGKKGKLKVVKDFPKAIVQIQKDFQKLFSQMKNILF